MVYSALGTTIWTIFLAGVGYYFGNNVALIQEIFNRVGYIILGIVCIFFNVLSLSQTLCKKIVLIVNV